jgi:Domain of unknown function (DUF4262)
MTKKSDFHDKTRADIEQYGCSVIMLEATDYLPSFAYSIGLWQKYKQPEIICFGLNINTLQAIINIVKEKIQNGESLEIGENYTSFLKKGRTQFLNVDTRNLSDYFGTAIDFYGSKDFPAMQFVWTDSNNIFPWEEGFNEELKFKQPLLDRNADFKFREAKNLGVFTTKQWLENNKPILKVIHDSDGDWQFLTDEQSEDGILVALEQLILQDSTLNEVFDLDYGEAAEREQQGGKWTRFDETDEQ